MPKYQTQYQITFDSVQEYLLDLEQRWGVKFEFKLEACKHQSGCGELIVTLYMPHQAHMDEIHWVAPYPVWYSATPSDFLARLMWDMCYRLDREIERGPLDLSTTRSKA